MNQEKEKIKNMRDMFKRIKTIHGLKKDEEIWEMLELSRGFYQEVKAGRKHVSNEAALRIASKASLPQDAVLVFIAGQKPHSAEEKAIWRDLLKIITKQRRIMYIM